MTAIVSGTAAVRPRAVALPSARRLLLWTGLAVLIAWVLVPIYFVALGAFGGVNGSTHRTNLLATCVFAVLA